MTAQGEEWSIRSEPVTGKHSRRTGMPTVPRGQHPHVIGRHPENIYAKIRVTTRAGAALFAMEHRLLG